MAQEPSTTRVLSASEQVELAAQKQHAQTLFEGGLARIAVSDWAGAVPLFSASIAAYPTRVGFVNLSVCLKRLGRPSEALDVYDELARRLPAEPGSRDALEEAQARAELRAMIAEVVVKGTLSGAAISVDGRSYGTTPLAKPLRLDPGEHVFDFSKEGYEPLELRLVVSAGETRSLSAELRSSVVPELAPPVAAGEAKATPKLTPAPPPTPDPARFSVAMLGGLSWTSSFAGDAERSCAGDASAESGSSSSCPTQQRPPGPFLGLRFGYLVLPNLAVELAFGYLSLERTLSRHVVADAEGALYSSDDLVDRMQLEAAFVAPGLAYRVGTQWPFSAGLAFGLARGRITAWNTATFTPQPSPADTVVVQQPRAFQLEEEPQTTLIPLLAPEVRIGARLQQNFVVSLGLALWMLFPPDVTRNGNIWNYEALREAALEVTDPEHHKERSATLPTERALGTFLIWIPSVAVTWEL